MLTKSLDTAVAINDIGPLMKYPITDNITTYVCTYIMDKKMKRWEKGKGGKR